MMAHRECGLNTRNGGSWQVAGEARELHQQREWNVSGNPTGNIDHGIRFGEVRKHARRAIKVQVLIFLDNGSDGITK